MTPFGLFGKKNKVGPPADAAAPERRAGMFGKLRAGLSKTRSKVIGGLRSILSLHGGLDDELLAEIEEQLYLADVGPHAVVRLCEGLTRAVHTHKIKDGEEIIRFLKDHMAEELRQWDTAMKLPADGPGVIMIAGVNGSGKTTSIAKLAGMYRDEGKRVLLAASDTFRAAAVEQLEIWAGRVGVDIVKNQSADPAAVAYDAADKCVAGGYDLLIVDTAGRLHTRTNLMMELQKICRVVGKKIPGAPHETLMVLDATTGQNAISQAIKFNENIPLTGIILTKLDGTARGGVIFGMRSQIDMPVKFVGVGEQVGDLLPFDPDAFVGALFD